MTWQTAAPLERLSLNVSAREARGLAHELDDGLMTVDLPYQRGPVWTTDQQIGLIKSWASGIPIPAIICNDRSNDRWRQAAGRDLAANEPYHAVIDGKQRLLTAQAWFAGQLLVPSSWFPPEWIEIADGTDDGPYVTYAGLILTARRLFANRALLPVGTAALASVQEEAELYLLLNGAGTPQAPADMLRAKRVACR